MVSILISDLAKYEFNNLVLMPVSKKKQDITNTLALPINKMLYIYLLCSHSENQKNPFQSKQSKHFHQRNARSDPAPMTAPVPFGMNLSSSQLLDLLHALRLGQFFYFSLTYFKVTHLKNLFYYPSISNPDYLPPPSKTLNLAVTQQQK